MSVASGTYACRCCKVDFKALTSSVKKFCSITCQHEFGRLEKYAKWLSGEQTDFSPGALRMLVEKRDGWGCSSCGLSSWRDKLIPLEVEHKDGNSTNNVPENLCFLCPNCHAQTDTYKSKNRGNGRHARRERYRAGKSF